MYAGRRTFTAFRSAALLAWGLLLSIAVGAQLPKDPTLHFDGSAVIRVISGTVVAIDEKSHTVTVQDRGLHSHLVQLAIDDEIGSSAVKVGLRVKMKLRMDKQGMFHITGTCTAVGSSSCGAPNNEQCACDERRVWYECDDETEPFNQCEFDGHCADTNCEFSHGALPIPNNSDLPPREELLPLKSINRITNVVTVTDSKGKIYAVETPADVVRGLPNLVPGHLMEMPLPLVWYWEQSSPQVCEKPWSDFCACNERRVRLTNGRNQRDHCLATPRCQQTNCSQELATSGVANPAYPVGPINTRDPKTYRWTPISGASRYEIHLITPYQTRHACDPGSVAFGASDKYYWLSNADALCASGQCIYEIPVQPNNDPPRGRPMLPGIRILANCDGVPYRYTWSVRGIFGNVRSEESGQKEYWVEAQAPPPPTPGPTVPRVQVSCIFDTPNAKRWAWYEGVHLDFVYGDGTPNKKWLGKTVQFVQQPFRNCAKDAPPGSTVVSTAKMRVDNVALCSNLGTGKQFTLINATCRKARGLWPATPKH